MYERSPCLLCMHNASLVCMVYVLFLLALSYTPLQSRTSNQSTQSRQGRPHISQSISISSTVIPHVALSLLFTTIHVAPLSLSLTPVLLTTTLAHQPDKRQYLCVVSLTLFFVSPHLAHHASLSLSIFSLFPLHPLFVVLPLALSLCHFLLLTHLLTQR